MKQSFFQMREDFREEFAGAPDSICRLVLFILLGCGFIYSLVTEGTRGRVFVVGALAMGVICYGWGYLKGQRAERHRQDMVEIEKLVARAKKEGGQLEDLSGDGTR